VLQWAVVLVHPDRPDVIYVVPADYFPMTGTPDVAVPEEALFGPLALRCGLGFWAGRVAFASATRTGFLDETALHAARKTLADLAAGQLDGDLLTGETDDDPDYEEHIAWLAPVVERVAVELNQPAPIYQLPKERERPHFWQSRTRAAAAVIAFCLLAGTALYTIPNRRGGPNERERERGLPPVVSQVPLKEAPAPPGRFEKLPAKVELGEAARAGSEGAGRGTTTAPKDETTAYAVPPNTVISLAIRPPRDGVAFVARVLQDKWDPLFTDKSVVAETPRSAETPSQNVCDAIISPDQPVSYLIVITNATSTPVSDTIKSAGAPTTRSAEEIEDWKARVAAALERTGHRWYSIEEVRTRPETSPAKR
jgi:hypothetical protein